MEQVIKVGDQSQLVPTGDYPKYASFPFPNFNPVQSRIFEFYSQDCNAVVAAATSAGKTVCAEMFMANEVRERGGKAMYLAPLKALAQEKIDDWTSKEHHFQDLKVSICTGDYRLTPSRKKELEEAKVMVFSTEMLNSRCRNFKSESNEFLKEIGTVVVDESHLLTVPGRGDHLEVALMKLTQINPSVRVIFLSATMPNVPEIAEWLVKLNGKRTYLLTSKYRPCPLGIHYKQYIPTDNYEDTEQEKVNLAIDILTEHKDDTFLFFVHTKRTGELMKQSLIANGYTAEFHNADLTREKRLDVEKRRREGKLQCLVATSTLAWGVNMPARRVVIVGVNRGMNDVDTWDIWQMAGRAGRPQYDPRGDVYILLPDTRANAWVKRLDNPSPITSRLLDYVGGSGTGSDPHYKTLAFHLISEIHHKNIQTRAEVVKWFNRTLAHHQENSLDDDIVQSTLDLMFKCGAVREEDGILKATVIGMISSMFYYSPFDVADLKRNFNVMFQNRLEGNDLALSMMLGNVDSIRGGIVSKAEKADIAKYKHNVEAVFGQDKFKETAIKGGFAYYALLNGIDPKSIANTARTLQWDFPRLATVLNAVDAMSGKWGQTSFFKDTMLRVQYGVKREMVGLCKVADIGKARAERLWEKGIHSPQDIVRNASNLSSILNLKGERVQKILESASQLSGS